MSSAPVFACTLRREGSGASTTSLSLCPFLGLSFPVLNPTGLLHANWVSWNKSRPRLGVWMLTFWVIINSSFGWTAKDCLNSQPSAACSWITDQSRPSVIFPLRLYLIGYPVGQSWAARKDPEDILPVTSHAGLVESSPLIGFLLKEAIVNLGMLLLTARAYFCHCRGICSPEEAAGKGRPDKLASPAFKQVVWRLLASVGRSRSWHSLTQK